MLIFVRTATVNLADKLERVVASPLSGEWSRRPDSAPLTGSKRAKWM